MSKVSVIIPARNEIYLADTVANLLEMATGDVEVIAILDGYWPDPPLPQDKRLIIVHRERRGMRASINAGIAVAKGDFIMKVDAHCMFPQGYDEILKADCDKDWLVVPRRYSIETEVTPWEPRRFRPFIDYEYLSWPWHPRHIKVFGIQGAVWDERIKKRIAIPVDENLTFQGSCWFTPKQYFLKLIGQLSEEGYGTFIGEAQEIGLKIWLGGGKVMINKKCWYGHLWKGQPYRDKYRAKFGVPYTRLGRTERSEGNKYSVDFWLRNRWEGRKHDLEWLIDRFWPVPSWPVDKSTWIPDDWVYTPIPIPEHDRED